jgi:hypothetical protein
METAPGTGVGDETQTRRDATNEKEQGAHLPTSSAARSSPGRRTDPFAERVSPRVDHVRPLRHSEVHRFAH